MVGTFARTDVIEAACGRLRGRVHGGVSVFRGIPYAKPLCAADRFHVARPVDPWSDVRDFCDYGPACPQLPWEAAPILAPFTLKTRTSEDCLTLNVWTRGGRDRPGRPVMVWLHAGGFAYGSGASPVYDGTHLAQSDRAVVVNLNHRLNLFGFLYLAEMKGGGYEDASNVGMSDIIVALRWIRENIRAFGGNPDNVTLFGESGGGAKVSALLCMPEARGLFHGAIVQSGPLVRSVSVERAVAAAKAVLSALEIKALAELEHVTTQHLLDALAVVSPLHGRAFGPVIDNVTVTPFEQTSPAREHCVPFMIGSNASETRCMFGDPDAFAIDWIGLRPALARVFGDCDPSSAIAIFRESMSNAPAKDVFYAITNAMFFRMNSEAMADYASQQQSPVWRYELAWDSPVDGGKWGSPHTLDVPLVFGTLNEARVLVGDGNEAKIVSRSMQEAWLAFAEKGDPSVTSLPDWRRYRIDSRSTLQFGLQAKVVRDPYKTERLALAGAPLLSLTDPFF